MMQELHPAAFQTTTIPSALSTPNDVQGAALDHPTASVVERGGRERMEVASGIHPQIRCAVPVLLANPSPSDPLIDEQALGCCHYYVEFLRYRSIYRCLWACSMT
jgi:hypothetical protein